jgi:Transposase DDE domain group 1
MTPNKNHCIPEQFIFGQVKSCPVVVNFKGEPVTSDAGLTLIAELVKITIRGDSAYSREDIMSWCESQTEIDYVFGLPENNRLLQLSQSIKYRASQEYSRKIQPVFEFFESLFPGAPDLKKDAAAFVDHSVWYCSLDYQTLDSWSRSRRVVAKVDYSNEEVDTRFVVTSLPVSKIPPGQLYTQKYCPRGNMENCLKEQKLDLKSDRTSTHTFVACYSLRE